MATIDLKEYVDTKTAGDALGIAPNTVRRHCIDGVIGGVKFGTSWLISLNEVKRYKKERRGAGRPRKEHV